HATDNDWSAIVQARSLSTEFSNPDERDLGSFMNAIDNLLGDDNQIGVAAREVSQALDDAIIGQVDVSGANGLSIYLPAITGRGFDSRY
ncbi:hypothetical protein, partial [Limnospira indica]